MIVPVLTRPELLYRMLATVDEKVDHLVVIDNGGCVDDAQVDLASGCFTRVSVIHLPANLGVAGSWNLGIKCTPFVPWWLIVNFDITWPAGSLAAFAREANTDALTLSYASPPWCAFAIGEHVIKAVGLFDEALHPAYFEDDDMARRVESAGLPIHRPGIPVHHDNSSTIQVTKYRDRNQHTFQANADYYHAKAYRGDMTEGRWNLRRRRELSWD
jgi:GT2 family glycosyltransferase